MSELPKELDKLSSYIADLIGQVTILQAYIADLELLLGLNGLKDLAEEEDD